MGTSELHEPPAAAEGSDFAAGRPTYVRYLVLAAACVLAVITYIHRVGFATASTQFKAPLGLTAQQVGVLMAAFMVPYGLFEVPWGTLGDRLGVRNLLALIILGGSFTTAAVALVVFVPGGVTGAFLFLLILRFLFGMFQAGTFPALSRMMTDWMPLDQRGSAQGFIWMSSRLGGALAPTLLGPLFAVMGDWRSPLVLVAGLGLIWCVVFWVWFRNRPEEMAQVNELERKRITAGRAAHRPIPHGEIPWAKILRSRNVWFLCLMYGFLGYSGNFFLTLLPNYLSEHRHLSLETTNTLCALPFAFGVAACIGGGFLSDVIYRRTGNRKWSRRLVGFCGLALAGLAILGVSWVHETALLAFLLTLTFFGNDLAMGPAWAAAGDIGERYAGTVGGAMNMLASFTAAVGAILTGTLFDHHLLSAPFVIFAVSYALGALCWLGVDVTRTVAEE